MCMLSHRQRKTLTRLLQRKYREQLGQYLIEGVRALEAALAAGAPLLEVLVTAPARQRPAVAALLERVTVPVTLLTEEELARFSTVESSQGVLAIARLVWHPEEVLFTCQHVVVLDRLQDPGNAGTILRAAAWFGVDAVVAGSGTVDLYQPKVVRAAMGGHWDLRLVRATQLPLLLDRLRAAGFACYGADLEGTPAPVWQPRRPAVLVLGSEAHGLDPELKRRLDASVTVPGTVQRRATESLNVAMAAAVLLYEWLGRR